MKKNSQNMVRFLMAFSLIGSFLFSGCSGSASSEEAVSPDSVQDESLIDEAGSIAGDVDIQEAEIAESKSLVLSSLYTSDMDNPDCGNSYAENIPAVEVTNTSDQYLAEAAFTAVMSDGSEHKFVVKDLPAGKKAEVFDSENQSLAPSVSCDSIACTQETYLEELPIPEGITVSSAGSVGTITNNSSEDLNNLKVVYRCSMGDDYLGGVSYETVIDIPGNGGTQEVSDDTLMGEIDIVRVYQ